MKNKLLTLTLLSTLVISQAQKINAADGKEKPMTAADKMRALMRTPAKPAASIRDAALPSSPVAHGAAQPQPSSSSASVPASPLRNVGAPAESGIGGGERAPVMAPIQDRASALIPAGAAPQIIAVDYQAQLQTFMRQLKADALNPVALTQDFNTLLLGVPGTDIFSKVQAQRTQLQGAVTLAQAQYASAADDARQLTRVVEQKDASIATLTGERDTAQRELATARGEVANLGREVRAKDASIATLTGERDTAQRELATARGEVNRLGEELKAKEADIELISAAGVKFNEGKDEAELQLSQAQRHIQALEASALALQTEFQRQLEGFSASADKSGALPALKAEFERRERETAEKFRILIEQRDESLRKQAAELEALRKQIAGAGSAAVPGAAPAAAGGKSVQELIDEAVLNEDSQILDRFKKYIGDDVSSIDEAEQAIAAMYAALASAEHVESDDDGANSSSSAPKPSAVTPASGKGASKPATAGRGSATSSASAAIGRGTHADTGRGSSKRGGGNKNKRGGSGSH